MKILLAVDGSPYSDAAIEEVAGQPWPDGSLVKVVTAYELPPPPTPEGWALPANYFEEIDIALRATSFASRQKIIADYGQN